MTYGISGISPLGTIGLGSAGAYGSYDAYMPSTYGMGLGYGLDSTMTGYGGYNYMMNPAMMMQYPLMMSNMQNQIEASQLIHAGNMHGLMLDNEVQAYEDTDAALFKKISTNGDVQQGVYNLHQKIVEGDQKGISEEYNKLRSYIFNTYRSEFEKKGTTKNAVATANDYIEKIYGQMISSQTNTPRSLKADLKSFGESAFENGYKQGLHAGHNEQFIDETLNQIYGTRIDERAQKDFNQSLGKTVGYTVRGAKRGVEGAAIGAGATLAGALTLKGLASLINKGSSIKVFSKTTGTIGKWAIAIGAIGAIVGDIIWRNQATE